MIDFCKVILKMSLVSFSHPIFAEGNNRYIAKYTLEITAVLPKPPFIIEENGEGIEFDIFRDAFATVNKNVTCILFMCLLTNNNEFSTTECGWYCNGAP
jgi:hypothetical protein